MQQPGLEQSAGGTQQERQEGLLETAVSVITQPVATMHRLTQTRPISWAFVVAIVTFLISLLSSVAGMGGIFAAETLLSRVVVLAAILILGPLLAVILTAISAGIFHLSSRLLRGTGLYSGLFVGVAFAGVPTILAAPFNLLPAVMGVIGDVLSMLAAVVIGIWGLVLTTIAIRENNSFSTGRAIAALLIPLLVIVALVMMVGIVAALVAFAVLFS
jgi:hypothetical protein